MTPEILPTAEIPSLERAEEASADDPFLSLKRGASELYLIRHGDALPDAGEVVGEGYDEQGLSDRGRLQARALAERLRSVELGAIYSSPLLRARETAETVAAVRDAEVFIDDDLREVALGPIGTLPGLGVSAEEIARLIHDRLRQIALVAVTTGSWTSIPGSEPSMQLRRRLTGAVERIAGRHAGQRVALVSHAGAINAYLAAILGLERDYFFPTANTSISVVRVKGQRRMLFALNDVGHLREADLLPSDAGS
jgi:2,3-bisphosphoglycerate-dependent phosphoglycerate mutase